MMDKISLFFREMGFPSDKSRQDFYNKLHFDFSYDEKIKIKTNTSNNTKNEEICPIGVKSIKK